MVEIGRYNTLKVVKTVDFGIYLENEGGDEILLPKRQVPPGIAIGEALEVFIYKDSEDRIIATSKEPYATVDEFAVLKVVSVDKIGAWLDWGLDKHLLCPFREQKQDMEENKSYLVYLYLDNESQRLAASSKLDKFLDNTPAEYEEGQKVEILISNKTDIGYTAVINNQHSGLLYENEVFQKMNRGERKVAYIQKVRADEKIDLTLETPGYGKIDPISDNILDKLKANGGFLSFSDKSSPEDIKSTFQISKKNFKKAIGALYRNKIITIDDDGIKLA